MYGSPKFTRGPHFRRVDEQSGQPTWSGTMSMKKRVATAAILATLAACGGGGGSEITAPEGALLNGGVGFGSGHRSDTTTTTQNATAQEDGGVGFGSGH